MSYSKAPHPLSETSNFQSSKPRYIATFHIKATLISGESLRHLCSGCASSGLEPCLSTRQSHALGHSTLGSQVLLFAYVVSGCA